MLIVDPIRKYQINKNGSSEVSTVDVINVLSPIGVNNLVIPAVTGKCIRVMGILAQSDGASGDLYLLNGSGGVQKLGIYTPSSTSGLTFHLPVIDSGYFSTSVGVGLFSIIIGSPQRLHVYYFYYTP